MRKKKELEEYYVPSCADCQRLKSATTHPIGPLHPLPITEQQGDSVAIDFIGPLPKDSNFDSIITFTDCLGSDLQIVPTQFNLTAEKLADIFFDSVTTSNGSVSADRQQSLQSSFVRMSRLKECQQVLVLS